MGDMDQILAGYRAKLANITQLRSSLLALGYGDEEAVETCREMTQALEIAVEALLANRIRVAQDKQTVLDLKQTMGVSQQAVDAKSQHLDQEEKELAGKRRLKWREVQESRKIAVEKAELEKEISTAKRSLNDLMGAIDDKSERLRHLQNFHDWLAEFSASDVQILKEQIKEARQERVVSDNTHADVRNEISENLPNSQELKLLQETVRSLSLKLQRYKNWYEEELQTKLFYCSRTNEMKRRMNYLDATLCGLGNGGQGEVLMTQCFDQEDSRQARLESCLVDGFSTLPPDEMRQFVVDRLSVRLTTDCNMLSRFQEVLDDMSLAYLMDSAKERKSKGAQGVQNASQSNLHRGNWAGIDTDNSFWPL